MRTFDANYGTMNEHQLSIGECTDKAKIHPEPEPGKRIFYFAELSRVALERTKFDIKLVTVLRRGIGFTPSCPARRCLETEPSWIIMQC